MPTYMVERVLPGATMDLWTNVRRAVVEACHVFAIEGKPVRYVHSTFTPGDSRCRCLFEAPNAALVREVNEAAEVPYGRIILAVQVTHDLAGNLPP